MSRSQAADHPTTVTGALIKAVDWDLTALGPMAGWPYELRSMVGIMQTCGHPMALFWGRDRIQLYNDAFLPILGEKHPQAMGQSARDCWAEAWPIVGAQIEQVIEHGRSFWNESLLVPIRRQGNIEEAWFTYSYSPVFENEGTRVLGALVICSETTREVHARRQAEAAGRSADLARQELRAVFLQAPLPMCILTGPDHRFALANEHYLAMVDREVMGKPLVEAFTAEEVGFYLPILDRVYGSGQREVLMEAPLSLPDTGGQKRELIINVVYQPYRDPEGNIGGVLVLVHDVTTAVASRRQLERLASERAEGMEREQRLRHAAEAASRARDEFLAMLGHELRNPLAPILTALGLMEMRGDASTERERKVIERQVTHLSHLLEDLLDVARVTRGKIALDRRPLEIGDAVAKAVEMASPLFEQRAHALELKVAREGLLVDGDPVRLAQVLANLLTNAAKYTPPRGQVRVGAVLEGRQVVVRVADTGPGLPPQLLPDIFDLFVQGPRTLDRVEGGLGLGLALVKNLVALHDGTVSARNLEGGGSEFTVRLPAIVGLRPAPPPVAFPAPRSGRGRRVLLVDDNVDAAVTLAEALRESGYQVAVAHDGPSALHQARDFRPEVALLDIGLPVMDGFELARRIREESSESSGGTPRLIALTGYGQAHDRQQTRSAGFDEHLTKPVDLDAVIAAVEAS